ncbi:MAG: aminotransferase class III-fold pyridoxal phosphate-dependent enzyme, partial [Nitrososphaerota archaeon]|nr:aminotransferase class III-fold pyridoxal phosphate-dependent enzyme [Nitrososphaerota archaeon]
MIFERGVKFSRPTSVIVSYLVVISVTALLQFTLGQSELSLTASVLLVSAFISFTRFSHPPAIELAERLVAITPPGLAKVFYSDNGSTACEIAIKMSLQYWRQTGH